MTLRENVHQVVDTIPESELDDLLDCLAEWSDSDEEISTATLGGIQEGLDDLRNGRTISHEELRRKYGLFAVDEVDRIVEVTMIEPRGQVYNRL